MDGPQYYTIKAIKKGSTWGNAYGEFQTYALAITGIGDPVKLNRAMPVVTEPKIGDVIYGSLIEEHAASGSIYYRIKVEKPSEADKAQLEQRAQWALTTATNVWIAQGCLTEAYDNIPNEARAYFNMVSNIRGDN